MVECIFTLDYEIYGNGEGSLKELVYEPAERLMAIFRNWDARFVAFIEVAELEILEREGTDPSIELVKEQLRGLHREGFELGLHLHPQWYNARYEEGRWLLDYNEYSLCALPRERIVGIVDRSIDYYREALGVGDFTPFSFRAGNWLFQPTATVADILAERGIKVDSSVFKGGRQYQYNLDYHRALRNGFYWAFSHDVNVPDPKGTLLELPIYTRMVPFWRMATGKRINLQRKGSSGGQTRKKVFHRLADFARLRYPLKLDFCRMSLGELTRTVDEVVKKDSSNPTWYRPVVAIGHTKDLVDFETVESFLCYLGTKGIAVSTLEEAYLKCQPKSDM